MIKLLHYIIIFLAYHYAKSDKNLETAEQLITLALTSAATNPHFLDTHALILYKQKKYDQALAILEPFINQENNDSALLHTLGKIYYKIGNKQKAIATVEHALQVASNEHEKKQFSQLLHRWNNTAL